MPPPVPPPSPQYLLPPLLASLPAAAVSPQPPTALLPLLSPILRQRVQLLSAATKDPWLPLLSYDPEKAGKLSQIAQSDKFEPHPVSGEVEVDWGSEVETRYLRVDEETLEAYVSLREFELSVKLLWCTGDQEGGGDRWRIGEVSILDSSSTSNSAQQGWESIGEAEGRFKETTRNDSKLRDSDNLKPDRSTHSNTHPTVALDEDDDDAYWAQYDNTPSRTPAAKRSPAPESMRNGSSSRAHDSEDAYYAQYASVQPAMDSHDPDEASQSDPTESTLNRSSLTHEPHDNPSHHDRNHDHDHQHHHVHAHADDPELSSSSHIWASSLLPIPQPIEPPTYGAPVTPTFPPSPLRESNAEVLQPRPTSSSSSSSSQTVEKLENAASPLRQSEIGVKQHISTSVKSLFRLARAAGMERGEFQRLVRTELDVLGLMEEDD
jgi:hypothetical protein